MSDPNSFDLNNQPRAADAMPAIPTSTSEVEVRTMASDVERMGQSGGFAGQAASAPQPMQVPVALHPEGPAASPSGRGKAILIAVIALLAVAGLFALGYFVLGG